MAAQQFGSAVVLVLPPIPLQAARTAITAGSVAFVTIACVDTAGNPLTPSALRWRLDDLTAGTVVQSWQGVPHGMASTTQLTIPANLNQLVSASECSEVFEVTFAVSDTMSPPNEVNVTGQYVVLGVRIGDE
jgi:hypothetical protein